MKFKELEKLLKKAGWTLYSTRGSGTVNSFAQISSDILAEV